MANTRVTRRIALVASMALVSAACGGAPEQARTVTPSETPGAPASAGTLPLLPSHPSALEGRAGEAPSPGHLTWSVPKGWIEEAPKSAMRYAQYRLPPTAGDREEGECVVYYFGAGQGGDVKSNLDRWASQFGGSGSSAPKYTEMEAHGLRISRAEASGTYTASPMSMGGGPEPEPKPDYMLLGAIVPGPDANWFFKCTGPRKTMEANRASLDLLLASVRPDQ